MGARNNMNGHHFSDLVCRHGTGISRRLDRADLAAHKGRDETASCLDLADDRHAGSLDHGIRCFDRGDQTARFDHSKGRLAAHWFSHFVVSFCLKMLGGRHLP